MRAGSMVLAMLVGLGPAVVGPADGQEGDAVERDIVAFVDSHLEEAVELLERIVNINSGTMNLAGVRDVGAVLRAELDALGLATTWMEPPASTKRAGHLFGRTRGHGGGGRSVLLIGHLDTVFEPESPFQRFERNGSRAFGPGVSDMKGGDVVIVFALRALAHAGVLDDADVTVALIGDEESPGEPLDVVRRDLIEAGRRADVALGFEGMVREGDNTFVTVARRSSSEWRLIVTGRQGHSSRIFSDEAGTGAIFEVARILNGFYEIVRGEEYLTFNAGAIVGGTDVAYDWEQTRGSSFGKTNVIPQRAVVHGGLRTISQDQMARARERMREIVARSLPGTTAEITFTDGYPPMAPTEGNYRLLESYAAVSRDLGLGGVAALDPGRRGAADISFVAPYTDALAGLGVVGSGAHGPRESIDLESLGPAIKRAAVMIYRLTRSRSTS